MNPAAIVLAGGQSRRFGSPKADALFLGQPLLQRMVDALQPVANQIVVVHAPGQQLPSVTSEIPLRTMADTVAGEGPARGLLTGIADVPGLAYAISCDVPAVEPSVLALLRDELHNRDAAVPVVDDVPQPLMALYRVAALAPVLEQQLAHGERSLITALDRLHVAWIDENQLRDVDPRLLSFRGANTPEELAAIEHEVRGT